MVGGWWIVRGLGELNGCMCVEMDKSRNIDWKLIIHEFALKTNGRGSLYKF